VLEGACIEDSYLGVLRRATSAAAPPPEGPRATGPSLTFG